LKVVSVTDGYEQTFWNHVNHDPLDHYFFILDWKQRREQTKILLAMDEKESVHGALLLYADYVVQFRGNREAVEKLIEYADLEKVELQAPPECEDIILQKYKPRVKQDLMLMRLNRGEEHIQITEDPVRLGVEDAEAVAGLMRRCDPEWWGAVKEENLKKSLETAFALGIKKDGRLASAGVTRFVDFVININMVATDEQYRNRGYATSIVSALVQKILERSSTAIIHVIADNTPAVRTYSKVGFKPYKTYLSIRT
jgi:uncharacterized protein